MTDQQYLHERTVLAARFSAFVLTACRWLYRRPVGARRAAWVVMFDRKLLGYQGAATRRAEWD
ncbi:hypothetical protein [Comamonas sp. B21-038]|uniref:hypothetical protein n=1 Tax=Comamonas sp. B21-038 TaxID=2918299 RepID=UPI001EFBA978|nr:hypothetical protein [Comamonas sp. B21-038]ULR87194.1 hypothetical protein MJ205_11955 [Comamonas sp. B21-038]